MSGLAISGRKSSEHHGVEGIAELHLVAARFDRCRRDDIEQRFDHFGGKGLFVKLWLLPRCPGTARHYSPVGLVHDRCFLDSYPVHGDMTVDDCSLAALSSPAPRVAMFGGGATSNLASVF
jgi:hypothetical protein